MRRFSKALTRDGPRLNSFPRLVQYVWPHRRKFYLSAVFAVLVAGLWGLSLSAAYPIITVLFENKPLDKYVDDLIKKSKESIAAQEQKVDQREGQLRKLDADKPRDSEREQYKILRRQSNEQSVLSTAQYKLMMLVWLRNNVVPKLPKDRFDLLAVELLATLAKGICEFVQENLICQLVELSLMGVRKDCLRRVLRMDYQTVSLKGTPKLMSHFTNDMNVRAAGLRLMGGKIIQEPLKAIVCIGAAMVVCWQLTLLSLLTAPVLAIVFARIGSSLKRASHRMMDSMTRLYKT